MHFYEFKLKVDFLRMLKKARSMVGTALRLRIDELTSSGEPEKSAFTNAQLLSEVTGTNALSSQIAGQHRLTSPIGGQVGCQC